MTSALTAQESLARLRRAERYRRRDVVWNVGQLERVRHCGRRTNGKAVDGAVDIVVGPDGAGYRGLAYCGSVWACAVCSAVIRQRRAAELEAAVMAHFRSGGSMLMVTFTVPHKRSASLLESLTRLRDGFHAVKRNWRGRALLGPSEGGGVDCIGTVTALEVTDGRHGWHPHLHVLFFLARPISADRFAHFRDGLRSEWDAIAVRAGWPKRPEWDRGIDVQQVAYERQAARYIAKVQGEDFKPHAVALELTRGDLKVGRRVEQMTPFELLDGYEDAVRRKGPRAGRRWCAKWREYEATMKGRRCIFWSKGLRERFALDPELTDEEIVAEVGQEGASVIATLYPDEWRIIVVQRMRAQLLDAAERRGAEGVAVFMEAAWRRWWSMEVRDDDPPEPVYDDDMVELGLAEGWWD